MKTLSKILSVVLCLAMVLSFALVGTAESTDELLATFNFPASDTTTSWKDGSDIGATKTYTDGSYSLVLTNCSKVYDNGNTSDGTGFLKFGTSSVIGTVTFTVPDNVTKVVLSMAGYKSKTSKYSINGGSAVTLTAKGDDNTWEDVTVDTSTTKTVTVASVSGATRLVISSVKFYSTAGTTTPCDHAESKLSWGHSETEHWQICSCGDESTKKNTGNHEYDTTTHMCVCGVYETVTDPKVIVDWAFSLDAGATLPYSVTLTGTVKSIDTSYNPNYKNLTITMEVEGTDGKKDLVAFRAKAGTGISVIDLATMAAGDTVTVSGIIKNYVKDEVSTIEFDAGCTIDAITAGDGHATAPTDPKAIVDAAFDLEKDTALNYTCSLTGTIVRLGSYNSQYRNRDITIAVKNTAGETKELLCYRAVNGAANVDIQNLYVGDTVTISGLIINYNNTVEFNAGCTLDAYTKHTCVDLDPVDHDCDICGDADITDHVDTNPKDHVCDNGCTEALGGACSDAANDGDHNCDYCGTAIADAECSYTVDNKDNTYHWIECAECGQIKEDSKVAHDMKSKSSATVHWTECACGHKTEEKPHEFNTEGSCDCGYANHEHVLSDATCTEAAHCTIGTCTYTEGTTAAHTPGAAATCTTDQICTVCEKVLETKKGHTAGAAATCTTDQVCTVCDAVLKEKTGHTWTPATTEAPKTCSVCGATEGEKLPSEGTTTVSTSISNYATANGWENSKLYATLNMNADITVTVSGTPVGEYGQNTGKYYESNGSWRIYQNEVPSVTITTTEGTIVSVKITYSTKNDGILTLNGENVESGQVVTVNGTTVTFSVGNTGDKTNGQAQITAIEVIYTGSDAGSTGGNTTTPGTMYLAMYQKNLNKTLYLAGGMDGYYLATTENIAEAVPFFVEETTGGVHLGYMDGDKKVYINLEKSGTHINAVLGDTATTVYTLNTEYNTYVTEFEGESYYLGTYNNFSTFGFSKLSYAATSFTSYVLTASSNTGDTTISVVAALMVLSAMGMTALVIKKKEF